MLDLTDKSTLLNQLSKHHLWLKKRSGQNFLVDQKVLDTILDSANLDKSDTVLEIGPGLGTMTIELCKRAGRVIAVEIDPSIVAALRQNTKGLSNLEILLKDSLDLIIEQLKLQDAKFKIVANIPYNITSPLLTKYLYLNTIKPKSLTLLVQKEVAERIIAGPHTSQRGYLSVMVQTLSNPKIIDNVLRGSFFPIPKVDSAIVQIYLKKAAEKELDNFFQFVKMGFSQKRKMLKNSLSAGLNIEKPKINTILQKTKITKNSRAEDLTIKEWRKLYKRHSELVLESDVGS